jgi:hypothetical protein
MKNLNILKKAIVYLCLTIVVVVLGVITCKVSYALVFNNSQVSTVQSVKPHWQRVAENPNNKKAMMYKVDLNNNDKILEKLSYSDCIYKDDSNAWYCPVDCYQEELEHINKVNDSNIKSVVPSTPYVSHISKILKQDYR